MKPRRSARTYAAILDDRKVFQEYARRPEFIEWAYIGKPEENRRFAIIRPGGKPREGYLPAGLQWVDLYVGDRGRIVEHRRSGGAFYDVEDHPEGAVAWARSAVRHVLTKHARTR
jgi:hypothetical protein